MPETKVAEQVIENKEQTLTQPEVTTQQPQADVDKMSLKELEEFVKPKTVSDAKPEQKQGQPPAKDGKPETKPEDWIEIKDDAANINLRFKSQDEVNKSLIHSQKLIKQQKQTLDRYNAERGEYGRFKKEYDDSQKKISELSQYIAELQSSAQTGQSHAVQQGNLSALTSQAKPGTVYAELARMEQALLTERQNNESIRQEMTQVLGGLKQKEAEAVVTQGVKGLYTEVDGFLTKHPEYKTDESFSKLDDIVSDYGEEVAKTMMSESDYTKYEALMELVNLYKCDSGGSFDIARKNFNDLDEAFLIHMNRSGKLSQLIAEAHKSGVANYEQALNRSAQSATVLPNNLSTKQTNVMGPSEIQSILDMDPETVKRNPELKKRFDEAMNSLGIKQLPA